MILADKIINERKKNGWSQEEMADKLGVSRQAVSKWESAQSIPDLKRVVNMAQLFGVSTDYLLLDEMEDTPNVEYIDKNEETNDLIKVSMEEANEFLTFKENHANKMAGAVSLCIISPTLTIFLAGLAQDKKIPISEDMAGGMGMCFLLLVVSLCVFYFIQYGIKSKKYDYLTKESIETEYGVTNVVKDKERQFESHYSMGIGVGVVLCIMSAIPLFVAGSIGFPDYVYTSLTSLLLILVAVGVYSIIRVSMIKNSYESLLEEGEYSKANKTEQKKLDAFDTIYWCLMTAIYLGWSFITMRWDRTWILWPVAGVAYGAFRMLCSLFLSRSK